MSSFSYSLNCRGRILSLAQPLVMGILNLTPDSFSDGGKYNSEKAALQHVEQMLDEGADMIDIGGYSSRPFSGEVTEEDELRRIEGITDLILKTFPEAIISIDTFRSGIARNMMDMGVHIINDIAAGNMDERMMEVVGSFQDVPYIMMHMLGTPQTMQKSPEYEDVITDVRDFFVKKIRQARQAGIKDVVIDPGFGFGKTIDDNYRLLGGLKHLARLNEPVLAGISRKSMVYKFFDTDPLDVLEPVTALHLKLLESGANILRVHDVQAAVRIVKMYNYLRENGII